MDSGQLMSDALTLMVLGIGTVFVFLSILVCLTSLMSSLVNKLAPELPSSPTDSTPPVPELDPTLLAVITAAIHAHRSRS